MAPDLYTRTGKEVNMSGPCSLPNGNRAEWLRLNEQVCNIHHSANTPCVPGRPKKGKEIAHEFVTLRVWLAKRNRLRTGKTR